MEEILLALGLKSILSIILPIIVIIALIMIVSRLGDIRDELKKIKKNIISLRSRAEMQDTYESFDRDLSMSDEEKAIEKAKNKLFEHMQKEPEPEDSIFLQVAIGLLVIGFVLFRIRGHFSQLAKMEPLPHEIIGQGLRLGVLEHSLDLGTQFGGLKDLTRRSGFFQLIVGHRAPQKIGKAGGEFIGIQSFRTFSGVAFRKV